MEENIAIMNCVFNNCCEAAKSKRSATLCNHICNRSFESILSEENINNILQINKIENLCNWKKDVVSSFSNSNLEKQYEALCIGIASLELFLQLNWVGPPVEWDECSIIPPHYRSEMEEWNSFVHTLLEVDGENIYHLVKYPSLLALSETILSSNQINLSIAKLWYLRCLRIHQELLEEKSATVFEKVSDLTNSISEIVGPVGLQIQLQVEMTHLMYFFYKPKFAENYMNKAKEISGLEVELSGALGKRTRFQQNDISQLLLHVKRKAGYEVVSWPKTTLLPKDVSLDDDTVLETIKFTENIQENEDIGAIDQILILGLLYQHRKTHEGIGDILKEESLAYVNYILSKPLNWAVQMKALLLRCVWEQDNTRRLQRSLSQLEELVNQYKRQLPPANDRLHLLHSVTIGPKWSVEKLLADLFYKLDMFSSALEVYLRLEMWEPVIKCYAALGRKEKAENVIRSQLEVKETPDLYCYLGDVTNDPKYYEKAWELSNSRHARSQRCLAYYYLRKLEFSRSLPHFQKAVAINSLQVGVWFSYGCAALACEDFSLAAKAFNRCVTLEPNNFEAWNNLATAYVRTNQKTRAFTALQEAIKCEYENWRLWENLMIIGCDLGEFSEVIRAYHRLLDLKDKYVIIDVLKVLVRAVNENLSDAHDKPSGEYRLQLQELFGRLTSKVTNDGLIWESYAVLIQGKQDLTQVDREKALQYLQKSHRCSTQKNGWEKDVASCKTIASQSLSIAEAYVTASEYIEDPKIAIQNLSSAKLMLRGVLVKIKSHHDNPVEPELSNAELAISCEQLANKTEIIENMITLKKNEMS